MIQLEREMFLRGYIAAFIKMGGTTSLDAVRSCRLFAAFLVDPSNIPHSRTKYRHRDDYGDSLAAPLNHYDFLAACVAKKTRERREEKLDRRK